MATISVIIYAVFLLFVLISFVVTSNGVVMDNNTIVVDAPKEEKLVNAPYPGKGYSFAVNFRRNTQYHNHEAPHYECSVDPSFLGYSIPWNNQDTGKQYCIFFPYPPEHLERSLPKSEDMKNEKYVTIRASLGGSDQISGSATSLFMGGFSILDMDKNFMQLNLTQDYYIHNLTIVGNTDVEVEWENHDKLTVRLLERKDFGVIGRAIYELKVPSASNNGVFDYKPDDFTDRVIFSRRATGQKEGFNFQFTIHYSPRSYVKRGLAITSIIFACVLIMSACLYPHLPRPLPDEELAKG